MEQNNTHPFTVEKNGIHTPSKGDVFSSPGPLTKNQKGGKNKRLFFSVSICLFFIMLFLGRTIFLQGKKGETYYIQAEQNRLKEYRKMALRGMIVDRFGIPLVENIPAFRLFLSLEELPDTEEGRRSIFESIASLIAIQPTELYLLLQEHGQEEQTIFVTQQLSYEQALHILLEPEKYPGFFVESVPRRLYLSSIPSLSHLLGYTGQISAETYQEKKTEGYFRTDEIGKTGIEWSAEKSLRGKHGTQRIEVNALGEDVVFLSQTLPENGVQVTLTIDAELQQMIEQRLMETLEKSPIKRGTVIALNPQNGDVLAMVSLPTYDSNLFAKGIDTETYKNLIENPDQPLYHRAISGSYPSGSIFKPFIAVAALAEGIIDSHTSFISTGGLRIGPWFFPDWKAGGHGVTDVSKAIAESVNTFFYIIGGGYEGFTGLGVEKINDYASLFGFGKPTNIDLPGEAGGFLPSKTWKEETKGEAWYVGDTYHLAIGQGDFLTTPLQMAVAVATLANGGIRYQPRIIDKIGEVSQSNLSFELPSHVKKVIPIVRNAMRQTITQGSGRALASLPEPVAGKTGTAQLGGERETHAWFTAFAPFENPDLVLVILVEEAGEGSAVAVPIASDILRWWFTHR